MKKLSLVMAAAMCATVGGVYATWNYAKDGEIAITGATKQLSVNITGVIPEGSVVDVTVGNSSLALDIDGETRTIGGVPKHNFAKLTAQGEVALNVSLDETAEGIKSVTLTFAVDVHDNGHAVYNDGTGDRHVFTIDENKTWSIVVAFDSSVQDSYESDLDADGSVDLTVGMSDIAEGLGIELNGDFQLPYLSDYNAFAAAIGNANMDIVVTASIQK